jgi:hypothetical protein
VAQTKPVVFGEGFVEHRVKAIGWDERLHPAGI